MYKSVVSVVMVTYAHENFIHEAIAGVLMQQCDFEVELIIANDCSPDSTDEIIQNIIQNHPRGSWIRYIKHEKNLGMMPNFIFALQQCKGNYVALCDGDDYWTDPLKLQKQVGFLEENEEYVLCFHQVSILKTNGEIVDDFITSVPDNYETLETLARLGNYIHTPSVVFRNVIKEFPYEFSLTPIGDYFLYMILAQHGKLKYVEEKMAVYRYNVGVISRMSGMDIANQNVAMYSCIMSYFNNERIKCIILDKQIKVVDKHYRTIELYNNRTFIFRHFFNIKIFAVFFKDLKRLLKKIKNQLFKFI